MSENKSDSDVENYEDLAAKRIEDCCPDLYKVAGEKFVDEFNGKGGRKKLDRDNWLFNIDDRIILTADIILAAKNRSEFLTKRKDGNSEHTSPSSSSSSSSSFPFPSPSRLRLSLKQISTAMLRLFYLL
jgi:hypothetical protein